MKKEDGENWYFSFDQVKNQITHFESLAKKFNFFFLFWISFCRLGGYLQIFRKKVSLWFFKIKPFTDFWNWTHKNIPYQNIAKSAISLYPTAQCTLPTCCFTEICNRILTYWSGALKSFIHVKMVLKNLLKAQTSLLQVGHLTLQYKLWIFQRKAWSFETKKIEF